jgi:CRP/FNR family transcriptional regulator, cyclic AMP receptor protein
VASLSLGGDVLADVPLFAGLSEDERGALRARMRRRRYPRGEVIFLRGDAGSHLYIVESGTVKIALSSAEGKEMILALLGRGDIFGEMTLLDDAPRSADAVALEPCEVLLLEREDFIHFLAERPRASLRLMAALSRRLRATDELVQDAAFFDIPARLASVLLRLADTLGRPGRQGTAISRRLTQGELAGMIGATRESVNKWLRFYERQGLITTERGYITVVRPEGLRQRMY